MSAAPLRLLAIQSVELNLSAFLLLTVSTPLDVRRLGYDLAARWSARPLPGWCSDCGRRGTSRRSRATGSISSPDTARTAPAAPRR